MFANSLPGTASSRSSASGQVSSPTATTRSLEASAVGTTGSARRQPAASAKLAQASSTDCELALGPESLSAALPQAPRAAAEVSEVKAIQRKFACMTAFLPQESCLNGLPGNPSDPARSGVYGLGQVVPGATDVPAPPRRQGRAVNSR